MARVLLGDIERRDTELSESNQKDDRWMGTRNYPSCERSAGTSHGEVR